MSSLCISLTFNLNSVVFRYMQHSLLLETKNKLSYERDDHNICSVMAWRRVHYENIFWVSHIL